MACHWLWRGAKLLALAALLASGTQLATAQAPSTEAERLNHEMYR